MQHEWKAINITTMASTTLVCLGAVWTLLLFFVDFFSPLWSIIGIFLLMLFGSLHLTPKSSAYMRLMDRRIRILLLASVLFCASTMLLLSLGLYRDVSVFSGSIFASWVASVFFFVSLGALATLVTLARPEQDSFDSRARILFRGMKGAHVEYAIEKIRQNFEHFAESATIDIAIEDYDENEQKFYVSETFSTSVHSFIPDTDTKYSSMVRYTELTPSPPGKHPNRLVYLTVGNQQRGGCDAVGGCIEVPIFETIPRNQTLQIQHTIKFWLAAEEEPNEFRLVRFTNSLSVSIRNQLPVSRNVVIKLKKKDSSSFENLTLDNGTQRQLLFFSDLPPDVLVYDYRVVSA